MPSDDRPDTGQSYAAWRPRPGACLPRSLPLGIGRAASEMRWSPLARLIPLTTGFAIVAASVVQLMRWKQAALGHRRDLACCTLGRGPDPCPVWRDGRSPRLPLYDLLRRAVKRPTV
jgi:hypothetical protein